MTSKLKKIGVFCLVFFVTTLYSQDALSRKERRQQEKEQKFVETQKLVNEKQFVFEADRAYPTGYRSVNLVSNPNYLHIQNDSVSAGLPYFGRAYSVSYGSNRGGIWFEKRIGEDEIEIAVNEKKLITTVSFTVDGEDDRYHCSLDVFAGGSASLVVTSNNKQSISYSGRVEKWEQDEEK